MKALGGRARATAARRGLKEARINNCGSTTSLAVSLVVSPSCTADFNRDGNLNSQDFFDFLTAFFAGCP